MLYCEENKAPLREVMRGAGLRELNFRFDFEGSKVIFDVVSRDGRLAHIRRQNYLEEEKRKSVAVQIPASSLRLPTVPQPSKELRL
jgi:hypothetical protein